MESAMKYAKSSYSGGNGCVEVALLADGVFLRDSKNVDKEPHHFTPYEWRAFVAGVRNGEFDLP
jgi:hypothetical protein